MPDIQTALKAALSTTLREWDDDGEQAPQTSSTINTTINNSVSAPSQKPIMLNQHKITNNVSRVTFNYVKDNPGSTRQEIIRELGHQGFGKGSISSLLAQMRRSKMIHDTNGLWYADVKEYAPIKNPNYKSKAKPKLEKKATPAPAPVAKSAGLAALHADTETPVRKSFLTKLVRTQAPEDIISNMTVYQARELYLHLKSMFGG